MKATRRIALFLAMLSILAVLAMPFAASAKADDVTASRGELLALNIMVEAANVVIEGLVKAAQYTPYNDVALLLFAVDCIVTPIFEYGESIGVEVVCEYTEYEIDGQLVLVDPLRVINPPPKGGPGSNGEANNKD